MSGLPANCYTLLYFTLLYFNKPTHCRPAETVHKVCVLEFLTPRLMMRDHGNQLASISCISIQQHYNHQQFIIITVPSSELPRKPSSSSLASCLNYA